MKLFRLLFALSFSTVQAKNCGQLFAGPSSDHVNSLPKQVYIVEGKYMGGDRKFDRISFVFEKKAKVISFTFYKGAQSVKATTYEYYGEADESFVYTSPSEELEEVYVPASLIMTGLPLPEEFIQFAWPDGDVENFTIEMTGASG